MRFELFQALRLDDERATSRGIHSRIAESCAGFDMDDIYLAFHHSSPRREIPKQIVRVPIGNRESGSTRPGYLPVSYGHDMDVGHDGLALRRRRDQGHLGTLASEIFHKSTHMALQPTKPV
jgi:hypothetical protein